MFIVHTQRSSFVLCGIAQDAQVTVTHFRHQQG